MDIPMTDIRLLGPVCLLLVAGLCYATFTSSGPEKFWKTQDFVGLPDGMFARFRGGLQSIKGMRAMVYDGYKQSSKTSRGFAISVFASDPIYVLPAGEMRNMITKPDASLNATPIQLETTQVKYTIGMDLKNSSYHFGIVKRQLTRKLALFTSDIYEELALGFATKWGRKTEWTSLNVYPTCMSVVSQAANRIFAGTSLCRNETFILAARDYTVNIFTSAGIINLVPRLLRPVLGPLITLPVKKQLNIVFKEALPVIKERMTLYEKATRSGALESLPNDSLSWLVEDSLKVDAKRQPNDPLEHEPTRICRRLLAMNMVAIHTTSIVITNLLMDLFSSPSSEDMVAGLREEIDRVFKAHGNEWTKAAVDDLIRVDSAVRECLRFSSLGTVGMHRMVVDPEGIVFGDVRVPQGVVVAAPNIGIHRDPTFYPRPDEFDAFRFSRPREEYQAKNNAEADSVDHGNDGTAKPGQLNANDDDAVRLLELKRMGLVTTTDTFLGFGHGRHACPGRFFASQELKLMLVYILNNYDIRIPGNRKRPENIDMMAMCMPSEDAKIEVRWRGRSS